MVYTIARQLSVLSYTAGAYTVSVVDYLPPIPCADALDAATYWMAAAGDYDAAMADVVELGLRSLMENV